MYLDRSGRSPTTSTDTCYTRRSQCLHGCIRHQNPPKRSRHALNRTKMPHTSILFTKSSCTKLPCIFAPYSSSQVCTQPKKLIMRRYNPHDKNWHLNTGTVIMYSRPPASLPSSPPPQPTGCPSKASGSCL